MEKWNEPRPLDPSWLDKKFEIKSDNRPEEWKGLSKSKLRPLFVIACYDSLKDLSRSLPITPFPSNWFIIQVIANAAVETGWGTEYKANNLGGWKITQRIIQRLLAQGRKPLWWTSPGNKAPGATLSDYKGGDPPWCYYRGFESMEEYFEEWLETFVPHPARNLIESRYYKTGTLFWSGDEKWFRELCLAGYKGRNTEKNPDPSFMMHQGIVQIIERILCQRALGVSVDGVWGPKSKAACIEAERTHGLPETGEPSHFLLDKISPLIT